MYIILTREIKSFAIYWNVKIYLIIWFVNLPIMVISVNKEMINLLSRVLETKHMEQNNVQIHVQKRSKNM